jgi:hypothetical protein
LRKVGIDGGHPKAKEVAPPTPPTIEDIIREFVAGEVQNALQNEVCGAARKGS